MMRMSEVRKLFDKSVYDKADRAAKDAAFKFISTMNYTTVDTTERKDFDILCKARTETHHLYEVEVKYAWKGEWPESWTEIRIPHRKKRLLDKWQKEYPNALFTFMVFRNDCEKAWHIDANVLLDCEVKEAYNKNISKGEKFFHIPVERANLIDIP